MKNVQNFINNISSRIAEQQEIIRLEEVRLEVINSKIESFDEDKFTKALKKVGVEELSRYFSFESVVKFNGENITEDELRDTSLSIDLRVKSIKIKPIMFAGYTKGGSGKNRDRLVAKAKKLENKFTELTGYRCDINECGMEVKSGEEFTFSITFYI